MDKTRIYTCNNKGLGKPGNNNFTRTSLSAKYHCKCIWYYGALLDGLVFDHEDQQHVAGVSEYGQRSLITNTLMQSDDDKNRLAAEVLEFVRSLS